MTESISNTTSTNEQLRRLVMDHWATRDECTNAISNQLKGNCSYWLFCQLGTICGIQLSWHFFFPIHVSWKPWWFFSSVCHSVVVPGFIMGGFFILTKPLFFYLLTKPLFCLFTPMVPGICSKLNTQLAVLYSDFKITKAQFEGFYWSLRYKWNNFWCF